MAKTYLCTNKDCVLGTKGNPGRFSGGITQEQATMLGGDPEAEHGKGVCPNCGQKGKEE